MGLMPPGSAKSTYTSIVFPVHVMGRFAGRQVLVASYGALCRASSAAGRAAIIRQETYRGIFNTALSKESAAADQFALTNGSEYMGAGILAGITGNRADGVVWDDLIKGRDQADSKLIRDKTWDAYIDDLLTRKKPGAWEIGITTRWHEDDIAGRILPEGYNGESGTDRLPRRQPVACRLHSGRGRARRRRSRPRRRRADLARVSSAPTISQRSSGTRAPGPRSISSAPRRRKGDYFKADWLRVTERIPPNLRTYGASDYAVTSGGGDYTVHVVVGLDPEGRMYLVDLWRKQAPSNEWVEAFCDLVLRWKPIGWAEEPGQIKSGVGPFLERRMRERRAFVARTAVCRPRRQGRARAIDPRPHGAGRPLRAGRRAVARRLSLASCSRFRPDGTTTRWMRSG